MTRRTVVVVDAGIAALVAAVVLILAPGLAAVAIIAVFVTLVCAGSLAADVRAGRRARRRGQR